MTDSELYRSLGELTKSKERWEESISFVASLLSSESVKIKAKALWMLGEMGLTLPDTIKSHIPTIAAFLGSEEPHLRERAVNALGRIGREKDNQYHDVMIGPGCILATAIHPISPRLRKYKIQRNKQIHIGNNVWLG